MARWKLTEPHYLNVPGTEWEQKETDRGTGKQVRKVYPVPLLLDPKTESDWNYPEGKPDPQGNEGIIVCLKGKGLGRDIVFEGEPTPGMLPLDDEAKEISAKFDWVHPIDDLSPTFSDMKLSEFQDEMAKVMANTGPDNTALIESQTQMASMMAELVKSNQMIAQLLAQPRRV